MEKLNRTEGFLKLIIKPMKFLKVKDYRAYYSCLQNFCPLFVCQCKDQPESCKNSQTMLDSALTKHNIVTIIPFRTHLRTLCLSNDQV